MATGVPTIVNSPMRQNLWRGSAAPKTRLQDVQTIYKTSDISLAKSLLNRYQISHVYVSKKERDSYGENGLGKFARFMRPIFKYQKAIIYKMMDDNP